MNYKEIDDKLKDINIEDHIWIIYVIIIVASWYSNGLERRYFIFNDNIAKDKYHDIIVKIFTILIFVYLYFLKSSIDDIKSLKQTDSIEKRKLTELAFIASLFIFISGLIYLYIAYNDKNIDVELAFN